MEDKFCEEDGFVESEVNIVTFKPGLLLVILERCDSSWNLIENGDDWWIRKEERDADSQGRNTWILNFVLDTLTVSLTPIRVTDEW